MKSPIYFFTNFINSVIFIIYLLSQNPTSEELKGSFYNYIRNTEDIIEILEIKREDIKGKNFLKILFC